MKESTPMTTLHEKAMQLAAQQSNLKISENSERRTHRRADLEQQGIEVERWDGARRVGKPFGQVVDLSAGGVRIRTEQKNVRPDSQIRLRLELPEYAGISPFIDNTSENVS